MIGFKARRRSFWEKVKMMFSRRYRDEEMKRQKAIIREMIANPDAPIWWE